MWDVEINWLAVTLATFSAMVVGSIWYAPPVFGKLWMKLAKVDQKKAEKSGWRPIIISVAVSFITAYVLAHVAYIAHLFYDGSFFMDAVKSAFWLWLGFTAARIITHDVFEGRPVRLTVMNIAHEFVTIIAMGAIIGLVGV